MSEREALDALFSPDSIAVVGASPDSWYSSQLVENCLSYGFTGEIYLVNPAREEAWGRRCYDSIEELPETVDLAVISIPREYVVGVARSAGERGVPAALVLSAGFAEADAEGERLESELAEVAVETGIRICGPNCIGVANVGGEVVLTSTCSRKPELGSVGLVSQSGALAFTTFFERGADERLHFSHVVSTGNEADLSLSEYVSYLADRDPVDVLCLYVEGVEDPHAFVRASSEAIADGTPVIVVKVGRSDAAAAASVSHTGSITGSDDAWAAAFRQAGVERVEDIPDLLARAKAHASYDPPASNRICIASTSGGLGSLLADMATERGLSLPPIEGESQRTLRGIDGLLTYDGFGNPADIRGYGADALPEITDALFADDAFDAYVFAIGLSAVDERAERIADDLLAVVERAERPVFVLWTGRRTPEGGGGTPFERIAEAAPLYADPGRCLDALASLVEAGERRAQARRRVSAVTGDAAVGHAGLDLPTDRPLRWAEAVSLARSVGIDPVETTVVRSEGAAVVTGGEIDGPVVLKVDDPALSHRSDAGAVALDLDSENAIREGFDRIVGNARAVDESIRNPDVLVQPMVDDGIEAIVGITREEGFGPVLTVGSGGVAVEREADATVVVPPVTAPDVSRALGETGLGVALDAPRHDREAFVDLVTRLGTLATRHPEITEFECNPVIVHGTGCSVVDLLCRIGDTN
ncbi:acetate--CoA ligase family protein [Natronorarus salvus]|uniref:acetate--CoA ligase family protein n=1 Tax=Natronorarus salvus TaxID=3117733 RepID=UPI002F25EDCB